MKFSPHRKPLNMENIDLKSEQGSSASTSSNTSDTGSGNFLTSGGSPSFTSTSQLTHKTPYPILPFPTCGIYRAGNLMATNPSLFFSHPLSTATRLGDSSADQIMAKNSQVVRPDFKLAVQPLDVKSTNQPHFENLPTKPPDVSQPFEAVHSNSPVPGASVESTQTIQAEMTLQSLGAYVGRDLTAHNVSIFILNPSCLASKPPRKSNFRFNMPTPTRHFKGRQDLLKAVRDYFDNSPADVNNCSSRMVAIFGKKGMGKTEIAQKFAFELKEKFLSAAWIKAETESSVLQSFFGLAKRLDIVPAGQKKADLDLVKEVYHHIDRGDYGSVLFIFDNAIRFVSNGTDFGIQEYLPTDDLPHSRYPNILITTEAIDWDNHVATLQVDGLAEKDSVEFFSSCFKVDASECADEFKTLHEIFDGHPQSMNLAVSDISYTPNKDSLAHLKQEIKFFIDKFKNEHNEGTGLISRDLRTLEATALTSENKLAVAVDVNYNLNKMPIAVQEIINACKLVSEQEEIQVCVKEPAKAKILYRVMTLAGGLLGGPIGMAAGGALGILVGYDVFNNNKKLHQIIKNMNVKDETRLVDHMRKKMPQLDIMDAEDLAALVEARGSAGFNEFIEALRSFKV